MLGAPASLYLSTDLTTMSKPQDYNDAEADLKRLGEMDIDQDFNVWSEFRKTVSSRGGSDSFRSFVFQASSRKLSGDALNSQESKLSTPLGEVDDGEEKPVHAENKDNSLVVSFPKLTAFEQRDIRTWDIRISRDTVFSRYYFPELWELRELETLKDFFELENPRGCPHYSNEPGQEATKKAITDIFFPGDHDAKSVLLKRGPILLDGVEERELLLFTHAFLLSRVELDSLLDTLFTINSRNPHLSPEHLRERFNEIDTDRSGRVDRCELKEVFSAMGMPISEKALSDILESLDSDGDGTVDFDEFESLMHELVSKSEKNRTRKSWGGKLADLAMKNIRGALSNSSGAEKKIECAYSLLDIEKIESVNVCHSERTQMFVNSSWAELIFAIFVKGREEPLIMLCSKPQHCFAWVDAFRTCYVKSMQLSADSSSKRIRGQIGWQHQVIRASLFSLVVCNDLPGLENQVANPSLDLDIDDQDEYHGYTALHYAVILDHVECAMLLIRYGAKVNLQDSDRKTPLDHATLSENKDMIQLLENHGATTHESEVLFKSAVEEQNQLKSAKSPNTSDKKMMARAKGAVGTMSEAMSALQERGDRLEELGNKTAQLQSGASDYAQMAKQMKEKNKKKSNLFGL